MADVFTMADNRLDTLHEAYGASVLDSRREFRNRTLREKYVNKSETTNLLVSTTDPLLSRTYSFSSLHNMNDVRTLHKDYYIRLHTVGVYVGRYSRLKGIPRSAFTVHH